jgi:hypothetical protein
VIELCSALMSKRGVIVEAAPSGENQVTRSLWPRTLIFETRPPWRPLFTEGTLGDPLVIV